MDHSRELSLLVNSTIGPVLTRGDAGYDEARTIWNGMFDRHPAVIVRCHTVNDVVASVNYARDNNLLLAVKGGGHHSAGTSVCDDGLMLDLSLMDDIHVDPATRSVTVQGGALLGAVDAACQVHGLAVPSGIISHTGAGGLTLGGGFGWISRKHGMTIDNLIAVEMVTADGQVVTADAKMNAELFWAVRGGGGNFGVVTQFTYKAVEIGTELYSGPIVKLVENFEEYARFHREYVRTLPDEMTVWMVVRHAPPLPFIPEQYHGKLVVLVPFAYLGDEESGKALIQPLREMTETIGDGSGMHPYIGWQSAFDGLVSHGARNYWKSHNLKGLPNDLLAVIADFSSRMPSSECEVFIPHFEGVAGRVAPDETAYPHRTVPFVMNIHTRWQNASDDDRCMTWAREFHEATKAHSQGVYVNFTSDQTEGQARNSYTPESWNKLVGVKNAWDPKNLFRMNMNIIPKSAG